MLQWRARRRSYFWWFCKEDTFISTTESNSFDQNLLSLRGPVRQAVHVGGEVPLIKLLPTGLLDWIISCTSVLLWICPVVVLLPVG